MFKHDYSPWFKVSPGDRPAELVLSTVPEARLGPDGVFRTMAADGTVIDAWHIHDQGMCFEFRELGRVAFSGVDRASQACQWFGDHVVAGGVTALNALDVLRHGAGTPWPGVSYTLGGLSVKLVRVEADSIVVAVGGKEVILPPADAARLTVARRYGSVFERGAGG